MCSTSKVNEALKGMSVSGGDAAAVPSIPAFRIKQNRSQYFLVDVREETELQSKPFEGVADATMTLGAIIPSPSNVLAKCSDSNQTIVFVCRSGKLAAIAAQHVGAVDGGTVTNKIAVLQHGIIGWENPAAVSPNFLVVLGTGSSTEKLTLALAAAAAAIEMHETVVLVLLSDGVTCFVRADSPKLVTTQLKQSVEDVNHGEPFKPCKAMLNKFLSSGKGLIMVCTSCFKHRGYSLEEDLLPCVQPLQMPDLIRMMNEANGGCLQFM